MSLLKDNIKCTKCGLSILAHSRSCVYYQPQITQPKPKPKPKTNAIVRFSTCQECGQIIGKEHLTTCNWAQSQGTQPKPKEQMMTKATVLNDICQECFVNIKVAGHLLACSLYYSYMSQSKPKDDGKRTEYDTGTHRSNRTGRGRYDLISPYGLKRLAIQYEHGAAQKGARNWEQGFPVSRACCSAIGHIMDYIQGDRSEDHLAAVSWQMFAAMDFEERVALGLLPKELLDIPPVLPETEKERKENDNK